MADAIVLDASAYLSFLLKEDQTEGMEKLLETHPLFAPELLWFETANGVLTAKRSHRPGVKEVSLAQLLDVVQELPIQSVPISAWWKKSVSLVQRYDLTFYDACYVACAMVLDLPLLTLDRKMIQVCRDEDLNLVQLR